MPDYRPAGLLGALEAAFADAKQFVEEKIPANVKAVEQEVETVLPKELPFADRIKTQRKLVSLLNSNFGNNPIGISNAIDVNIQCDNMEWVCVVLTLQWGNTSASPLGSFRISIGVPFEVTIADFVNVPASRTAIGTFTLSSFNSIVIPTFIYLFGVGTIPSLTGLGYEEYSVPMMPSYIHVECFKNDSLPPTYQLRAYGYTNE